MEGAMKVYAPKYSGAGRSGVCKCGHSWQDHHLCMVANESYFYQTKEAWIPFECEFFGSNEAACLDELGDPHCYAYEDVGLEKVKP